MDLMVKDVETILVSTFKRNYVHSVLNHYTKAVEGFVCRNWDSALTNAGKFVEASLKVLCSFTGSEVPGGPKFKVDKAIVSLEQTNADTDRSVRLTIPRACRFLFDIVSNRGARHDSDEFTPSKADASVVLPTISWILAEMLRLASRNVSDSGKVEELIDQITAKKNPIYETIDGRTYVNHPGLSLNKIAMLLLYKAYPRRILRRDLAEQLKLNNSSSKKPAIRMALTRLKDIVDENDSGMVIRQNGREQAETLISFISTDGH